MAEDNLKVRGLNNPAKWPIEGPHFSAPMTSTLHADVPEFVPGKAYNFQALYTHGMLNKE